MLVRHPRDWLGLYFTCINIGYATVGKVHELHYTGKEDIQFCY